MDANCTGSVSAHPLPGCAPRQTFTGLINMVGYFSAVVSGGTSYHAKTAHQVSIWFLPYFCHVRMVSTSHHTHYFSAVVSGGTSFHAKTTHKVSVWFLPYSCHVRSGFQWFPLTTTLITLVHHVSVWFLPYSSVILGVFSTNHHSHYFSVVVSGRTSFHAKTAHQVSVWLL